MVRTKIEPIHPGEILLKEYLEPLTSDTALRLARYFDTSERFWLNLQARYDLETEKDRLGLRLDREVTPLEDRLAR